MSMPLTETESLVSFRVRFVKKTGAQKTKTWVAFIEDLSWLAINNNHSAKMDDERNFLAHGIEVTQYFAERYEEILFLLSVDDGLRKEWHAHTLILTLSTLKMVPVGSLPTSFSATFCSRLIFRRQSLRKTIHIVVVVLGIYK